MSHRPIVAHRQFEAARGKTRGEGERFGERQPAGERPDDGVRDHFLRRGEGQEGYVDQTQVIEIGDGDLQRAFLADDAPNNPTASCAKNGR